MIEEAERLTTEKRYWSAVRDIIAGRAINEATITLQEIAAAGRGSVASWARESLLREFGRSVTLPA